MKQIAYVGLILLTAVLVPDVSAQTVWATQALGIKATVAGAITVEAPTPMNFGTVNPGTASVIIDPKSASAGYIGITGPPNAAVFVTITTPTALTNGSSSIPVTSWQKKWHHLLGNQSSPWSLPSDGKADFSSEGKLHVWLGATLEPSEISTTLEGLHTANVNVQVSYQ